MPTNALVTPPLPKPHWDSDAGTAVCNVLNIELSKAHSTPFNHAEEEKEEEDDVAPLTLLYNDLDFGAPPAEVGNLSTCCPSSCI